MKKNLLSISLVLILGTVAYAQTPGYVRQGSAAMNVKDYKIVNEPADVQVNAGRALQPATARQVNPNQSSTVCNVASLGSAANALGSASGGRTQVWYDQDLNTVVFTHRGECGVPSAVTNSGFYVYDVSTDGGTTWSINQGPIHGVALNTTSGCAVLGPHRGRYPKGAIYNPIGNTDPNNAHVVYTGPWNADDQSAATNWYGMLHGAGHLNGSPSNENYDSLPGSAHWPDDLFITKQGVAWKMGNVGQQTTGFEYLDTIALYKGIWNGTNDFNWTYYPIHYTVNPAVPSAGVTDMNIAFGDDGMIGYIAMITNQDDLNITYPDSTFYMQVLKTTDGGQTWSCPMDLDIRTCLDAAMIGQGVDVYATSWDLDIVVDKNNNPHITNTIVPKAGAGSVFLQYLYGTFGLFDFYSTDQGATWQAQLIAHPQTYSGQFGTAGVDQITEFLRPFISRTWDGSKLYIGWFDTDTATFGIFDNLNPDLRLVGYDVDANKWTTDLTNFATINGGENITAGSNADGACTFGEGPYYVKEGGPTPTVPVTYMVVGNGGLDVSLPCNFFYVDCAAPSGTFTFDGNPLPVTTHFVSPLCVDGNGVVLSVQDLSSELLVSSNYPNPFTGKTSVDVTLAKAGDVSIEISNVVGQTLVKTNYKNLHAGLNTLTIDGADLAHGMYFFTVKAGINSVTKTMTVE